MSYRTGKKGGRALLALAGLVALGAGALLYERVQDLRYFRTRHARRAWLDEHRQKALTSVEHLRFLAHLSDAEDTVAEWEREFARGLVCSLVRVPGEAAGTLRSPGRGPRCDRVLDAVLDASTAMELDKENEVWRIIPASADMEDK